MYLEITKNIKMMRKVAPRIKSSAQKIIIHQETCHKMIHIRIRYTWKVAHYNYRSRTHDVMGT